MMFVVIFPFVIGMEYLSILALPIFLSALLGVSFKKEKVQAEAIIHTSLSRHQEYLKSA